MNKQEAERLRCLYRNIPMNTQFQEVAEYLQEIDKVIDSMIELEPYKWEVGNWAYWENYIGISKTFEVTEIYRDDDKFLLKSKDCNESLLGYDSESAVPIPAPYGIGMWVQKGKVSFKIEKRIFDIKMFDWVYLSDNNDKMIFHKGSTVIPPPKYEWKKDEWFYDKAWNIISQVDCIENDNLISKHQNSIQIHLMVDCVPIHWEVK